MSDCTRTVEDVKTFIQSSPCLDSQQIVKFYDSWAEQYDQDAKLFNLRAANVAVDFLDANFSGSREEVQVLDVACGSGVLPKLMVELGFRHFVGVDGSKGMLDQAAKTGLYQELKLALLGTDKLPAQTGSFDLVILAGALRPDFVPVSVVRELCHAAKPGGLVCMTRGDHTVTSADEYKEEMERELQLMEEEGLWSPVGIKQTDKYMENLYRNNLQQDERFLSGTVYLYKKSIQ